MSTRSEGMVVPAVVSCLGMIVSVGIYDRGCGSFKC